MTITIAVAMVSGKKIGLMQRSLMQESISAPQVGGIVRFTGFFLKGIALIELLGAILLAPVFIKDFGVGKGIWYGVFHSISAFCNAGFDLMGVRQQYSSLTYYAGNGLVNAVIVLLILIGGLGFLTWEDIKTNKLQFKKIQDAEQGNTGNRSDTGDRTYGYFLFWGVSRIPVGKWTGTVLVIPVSGGNTKNCRV